MASPEPQDLTPSDKLFRLFQRETADITTTLERLRESTITSVERASIIEECQSRISRLSNEVRDAASSVPAHDRRIYSEGIQGLQMRLKDVQSAVAPKAKFSFKSAGGKAAAGKVGRNAPPAEVQRTQQPAQLTEPRGKHDEPITLTHAVDTGGRSNEHITIALNGSGSGNVSNVSHGIINLSPPGREHENLTSLTLTNISSSVILGGVLDGPIHLTNVTNCIIQISSRQFRMHDSRNCDVYLRTRSRPIIECCSEIRFAPLLADHELETGAVNGDAMELWQQVDDFNWHGSERNPNWSVLESSQRLAPDVWDRLQATSIDLPVDDLLALAELPG